MENSILYAIAGTPNGFISVGVDEKFDKAKQKELFEIKSAKIRLSNGQSIYSIRRARFEGLPMTIFQLYRYAYEMQNTRSGTYYSSILILLNTKANGNAIINFLNELANKFKNKCIDFDTNKFISVLPLEVPSCIDILFKLQITLENLQIQPSVESNSSCWLVQKEDYVKFIENVFNGNNSNLNHSEIYFTNQQETVYSIARSRQLDCYDYTTGRKIGVTQEIALPIIAPVTPPVTPPQPNHFFPIPPIGDFYIRGWKAIAVMGVILLLLVSNIVLLSKYEFSASPPPVKLPIVAQSLGMDNATELQEAREREEARIAEEEARKQNALDTERRNRESAKPLCVNGWLVRSEKIHTTKARPTLTDIAKQQWSADATVQQTYINLLLKINPSIDPSALSYNTKFYVPTEQSIKDYTNGKENNCESETK